MPGMLCGYWNSSTHIFLSTLLTEFLRSWQLELYKQLEKFHSKKLCKSSFMWPSATPLDDVEFRLLWFLTARPFIWKTFFFSTLFNSPFCHGTTMQVYGGVRMERKRAAGPSAFWFIVNIIIAATWKRTKNACWGLCQTKRVENIYNCDSLARQWYAAQHPDNVIIYERLSTMGHVTEFSKKKESRASLFFYRLFFTINQQQPAFPTYSARL